MMELNPQFLIISKRGSPIVKTGTVTNGTFTVEFYMPKTLIILWGDGRILAYAE